MKLQTQQEKRRQLKQHIQESRIQHQQGHKRYVEIGVIQPIWNINREVQLRLATAQ